MWTGPYRAAIGGLFLAVAVSGCESRVDPQQAGAAHRRESSGSSRFLRQIDWTGRGSWLKADTHIHSTFSDGAHSIDELASKAIENGCDVIAITDHADRDRAAATPAYFDAIRTARRQYPKLIILAGIEWNVPPFGGDEHATVLVDTAPRAETALAAFKQRFDDEGRSDHLSERAVDAIRWLADQGRNHVAPPVVIYNHPSRKAVHAGKIASTLRDWRMINDLVVGFSGAPGHQGSQPRGAYKSHQRLVDRWDPAAAEVGGAWDTLLREDHDVWAARAPSDFHNADPRDDNGFWPGQFSETWLYVPARTAAGALRALRAGTFFGVHGHIAREVELTVQTRGLSRPAGVGEVIETPIGAELSIVVQFTQPPLDWVADANQLDIIEIIAVTADRSSVIAALPPRASGTDRHRMTTLFSTPAGGVVIRARGRRIIPAGPDLLFYTNPIRVRSPGE